MKITMYELLGLVKDGKPPKKIKYIGYTFEYDTNHKRYESYFDDQIWTLNDFVNINDNLTDEVEIIEEKKIPEKLCYFDLTKDKNEKDENGNDLELHYTGVADTFDDVYEKINDILDYLDYLKSKGE